MSDPRQRGKDLRALWATLAVICLLGAGNREGDYHAITLR